MHPYIYEHLHDDVPATVSVFETVATAVFGFCFGYKIADSTKDSWIFFFFFLSTECSFILLVEC